jgi:predicted TIM-barrel fold metal-dependent hydrolase
MTSDYVTSEILEFMNTEQLSLMLHTSSIGMGDSANCDFIMSIVSMFPRIKIILAHIGRYFDPKQCMVFLDSEVASHPNIFLEMSSVSAPEVYGKILENKSFRNRLIFGSDLPFGLITGMEYWSEETGSSFITRDQYPWSKDEVQLRFAEIRDQLTYNTYHTIHALKTAVDQLDLSLEKEVELKEKIFYKNVQRCLLG